MAEVKTELGAGRKADSVKMYLESKVYPILQTALMDVALILIAEMVSMYNTIVADTC